MTARIPYHAGLLVADIDRAMHELSVVFGYTFNTPITARPNVDDRIDNSNGPLEIAVTYTREGPFRLELIEFSGTGVYGTQHGAGLHHLGVWEPDVEARLAELGAAGAPVDAVIRGADGRVDVFYAGQVDGAAGTRIEYVGEHQRARLERWFETGNLT